MMGSVIRHGRLIDPAHDLDREADLFIAEGRIVALGEAPAGFTAEEEIDARGQIVCPGLVDLRAHLREPGQEHKGTIASETRAAAGAGITTLCFPPNTDPVIDSAAVVKLIYRLVESTGLARVLPLGALTQGLAGEQISEMHELMDAGCIALSNGQSPMGDTLVMRRALEYAASLDALVMLYSEDPWLGACGCINEGVMSTRLGLPGVPSCAEAIAVGRDLMLVEQAGVRAHFSQLSTARAVEMVAEAQARGVPVTADVAAHHLFLTELDVAGFNSLCHVRPPLRTRRDLDAMRAALADGVVTAICSDHQPHDLDAKLAPFPSTEPGISALETLLPLTLRLVDEGALSLQEALARVTSGPAEVLGLGAGSLAPGARADICIFDPQRHWHVEPAALLSHGKNTPFGGWELRGKVTRTLLEGHTVYREESAG